MGKKGVYVPHDVWDWLMGCGDSFEPGPKALRINGEVGRYWWRSELRRKIDQAAKRKRARAQSEGT